MNVRRNVNGMVIGAVVAAALAAAVVGQHVASGEVREVHQDMIRPASGQVAFDDSTEGANVHQDM
jgi:hypothetical protein